MQIVKLLDALKKVDQKTIERELASARAELDKAQAILDQKEEAVNRLERFFNVQFKNVRVNVSRGNNENKTIVLEALSSYKEPVTRHELVLHPKIKKMFGRAKLTTRQCASLSSMLSSMKRDGMIKKLGGTTGARWFVRNA